MVVNFNKFKKNYTKGTNYNIRKNNNGSLNVIHLPTLSKVSFANLGNHYYISIGYTNPFYRQQRIGTKLRALATLYAFLNGKRITQNGSKNSNYEGLPYSTRILRNKLGWKPFARTGGKYPSEFVPGRNNINNALKEIERIKTNVRLKAAN